MSQEPDYLALWKDGTDLFEALSDLAGEIGEMAGDDARFDDPCPDLRERIRKAARRVDSLVHETRYRTLTLGWTELDLVFGPLEESPDRRYAVAVVNITETVETLLLEMAHGRGERYADYWPKKGKEVYRLYCERARTSHSCRKNGSHQPVHSITRRLEGALEQLEGTPAVKEELLRHARGGPQPGPPVKPTATTASSPAQNVGGMTEENRKERLIETAMREPLLRLPHSEAKRRPAFRRDHLWLDWHLKEELGAAAIRDRWNGMSDEARKASSASVWQKVGGSDRAGQKAGREVVKVALRKAKKERGS